MVLGTCQTQATLNITQVKLQNEPDHQFMEATPSDQDSDSDDDDSDSPSDDETGTDSNSDDSSDGPDLGPGDSSPGFGLKIAEAHDASNLEPAEEYRHDGKFMVCDHCHAHGLPCNEASVCDQCRLYDQPCIHRWCRDSRESKDACQNPSCRYTHQDSTPRGEHDPTYLILPGRLLAYMVKGRIPARSIRLLNKSTNVDETKTMLDGKQRQALAAFWTAVYDGVGTLENLHVNCGCCSGEIRQE